MDEETRIALLEIKGSLAELRLNVTERFTSSPLSMIGSPT